MYNNHNWTTINKNIGICIGLAYARSLIWSWTKTVFQICPNLISLSKSCFRFKVTSPLNSLSPTQSSTPSQHRILNLYVLITLHLITKLNIFEIYSDLLQFLIIVIDLVTIPFIFFSVFYSVWHLLFVLWIVYKLRVIIFLFSQSVYESNISTLCLKI
jgi:hypothetical protein